jgi:hypothetical protein
VHREALDRGEMLVANLISEAHDITGPKSADLDHGPDCRISPVRARLALPERAAALGLRSDVLTAWQCAPHRRIAALAESAGIMLEQEAKQGAMR